MTAVLCPTCSRPLLAGDPGRRGVLINRKASLGAKLSAQRTSLQYEPHPLRRAGLLALIEQTKAELAAVTEQLDAETKEPQ